MSGVGPRRCYGRRGLLVVLTFIRDSITHCKNPLRLSQGGPVLNHQRVFYKLAFSFLVLAGCNKASEQNPERPQVNSQQPRLRILRKDSDQKMSPSSWDTKKWTTGDRILFGSGQDLDELQKITPQDLREQELNPKSPQLVVPYSGTIQCDQNPPHVFSGNRTWARVLDLLDSKTLSQMFFTSKKSATCQFRIEIQTGTSAKQQFELSNILISASFDSPPDLPELSLSATGPFQETRVSQIQASPLAGAGSVSLLCKSFENSESLPNRSTFRLSDLIGFKSPNEEKTIRTLHPYQRCRLLSSNEAGFSTYSQEFSIRFQTPDDAARFSDHLSGTLIEDASRFTPVISATFENKSDSSVFYAIPKDFTPAIEAFAVYRVEGALTRGRLFTFPIQWGLSEGAFKTISGQQVFEVPPRKTVSLILKIESLRCLYAQGMLQMDLQWVSNKNPIVQRVTIKKYQNTPKTPQDPITVEETLEIEDQFEVPTPWQQNIGPGHLRNYTPYKYGQGIAPTEPVIREVHQHLC